VEAMDLVDGKSRDGKPTDADLAKARELLHSKQYHHYKAQIMAPIDQFFGLLDQRTQSAIDQAQARRASADWFSALAAMLLLGAVSTLCLFVSRGVLKPLGAIKAALGEISAGRLDCAIPGQDRKDEIGEMSKAVVSFKAAAAQNARLMEASGAHASEIERERSSFEQAQRQAVDQERAIVASSVGAALAKLAAKDLTYRMQPDIPDAYAKIRDDFNEAVGKLKATMLSVVSSTGAIRSGAQEISSASDDLSRRTEQQAASLEETAAALDEITATVNKSAEGATHARQVVAAADEDAKQSAVVVREAVEAMDAIAKSAGQISRIIGVIDEIAFQTNLLALNAGVEAARAGEAGRGFAVVASEVRALAQRSAEAAKEIKGLISASTTQVHEGVRLVAETGKSLERIMAQVTEINEAVAGIAAGAKEQATGLAEVNSAIAKMDQATQQNAAMVEQSTAASHSLSRESAQLAGLLGAFQIGGAPAAEPIRRELRQAARHVFRAPAKPPAPSMPRARPFAAKPARARIASKPAEAESWEEF
jgi:methyl-accepting chemotaxis protein